MPRGGAYYFITLYPNTFGIRLTASPFSHKLHFSFIPVKCQCRSFLSILDISSALIDNLLREYKELTSDQNMSKKMSEKIKVSCEMEVTLKMIGGKCKPLILHYLIRHGTKRYTELCRKHTPKNFDSAVARYGSGRLNCTPCLFHDPAQG